MNEATTHPSKWLTAAQWLTFLVPLACALSRAAGDVMLSLVAVIFLIYSLVHRQTEWIFKPWWLRFAYALWLWMIGRSLFAEYVDDSLERAIVWIRYPMFAAALCYWVLRDAAARHRLFIGLVIAVTFMAGDTFAQYLFGTELLGREPIPAAGADRLTGPFSAPRVGIMLVWMAFPAIIGLLFTQQFKPRAAREIWQGVLLGIGVFTVVFMSGERMAFLLAGFGFVVMTLVLPAYKRIIIYTALAAGISVLVTAYFDRGLVTRHLESTTSVVSDYGDSDYGLIWNSAKQMVIDYPLTGVGPRMFREICVKPEYGPVDIVARRCNLHPHNIYLEILVETGLIGFLLFSGMVFHLIKMNAQAYGRLKYQPVWIGLYITLFIRMWPIATTTSFFTSWSAVPFWLFVGWLLAYRTDVDNLPERA